MRGTLSVNGVVLTGADSNYTIAVTDTSGNALPDVATGNSSLPYGGVTAGRFEYQIPMDSSPTTACVTVSYNGTPLTMTYPTQGSCPNAGSGAITGLIVGDAVGFGGIDGKPNNGSYTFIKPLTATSALATAPTIDVQCDSADVNSSAPETFSTPVNLGQKTQDTTCQIINNGVKTLSVTALAMSGCGFSVASPSSLPTTSTPIYIRSGLYEPMTIAFAPCGVGAQNGTLKITSNATPSTFTVALKGTGLASISLAQGWNLVSLPAVPSNTAIGTVLSAIMSDVTFVYSYVGGTWTYYDPLNPGPTTSTLQNITVGNGYWFLMSSPAVLTLN